MASAVSEIDVLVPEESSRPATSWGAVAAGGAAAATATLVLMLVGSGLGLTMVSPFSTEGVSLTTLGVSTAVWLVVVQWLSAALGGYLAGRLRTKWVSVHTDEVFFRDTAHGFLAWALATLLVAGLLGSTISAIVGAGVQATSTLAGGAAAAATAAVADGEGGFDQNAYFVDTLLRPASPATPADPAAPAAPAAPADAAAPTDPAAPATPAAPADAAAPANPAPSSDDAGRSSGEISRILLASAASGEMSAEDRTYLEQLVAARAGLTPADAKARVDAVLARIDEAAQAAKQAADDARQAAATFALVGALSLIIGAFIASAAAALGGWLRDDNEGALMVR